MMDKIPMRRSAVTIFVLLVASCFTSAQSTLNSLRTALQNYLGTPDAEIKSTQFAATFVDLNDDGRKEAIVYLWSNGWCGTAGCTMLILVQDGASYTVISKIPGVRLPIRVLTNKSNGWHDIGVVGRSSANEPEREVVLPFDGKSYPYVSDGIAPPAKNAGKIAVPPTVKSSPLNP